MRFVITGLNHRTAPVEVRERLAFDDDGLRTALDTLKRQPGLSEGMILSTCNRVEIAATSEEANSLEETAAQFLAETQRVERGWLAPYLYSFDGQDAIRHLFRVASSLDSLVVGEPQILGQLKAAYAAAKDRGTLGGFLDGVVMRAFSVAKRVRAETEIGASAVSVSYAAVELAKDIFGSLSGKRVLIVGAGKMAESALAHLRRNGVGEILVTNRTVERSQTVAREFGGRVIDYQDFTKTLPDVDILLASSGAPHYVVTRDQVRRAMNTRRQQPMFLIDIAVPRNIEPGVNDLEGVFLYDIDDLERVVDSNVRGRLEVARQAEDIITEEVERMVARLKEREVAPTIVSLQEQLEQVRASELERVRAKLNSLTPQQQEAIEALTRGIVNKIAHGPISELRRQATQPGGHHVTGVIRKIFRLGDR
jgi:glutamyl-tRNA reductase